MDGISEVGALEVKKKSKKRKSRESAGSDGDLQVGGEGIRKNKAELSTSASDTVAEVVSSVDMNNDSNKKKEKDRKRKEKTEKNRAELDLKDPANDHKSEKKKKKNQIEVEEAASNVEKEQDQEEGHIKKKKKHKTIEPEVREKSDVEGVQGREGKAREEDKVKKIKKNKNKELSRKESDCDVVGHDDPIENQVNGVVEHIEPLSDRKKEKKKKKEDLREDLLRDSEIQAISHQDNGGVSSSKKKKKDKAATTVRSESDCAAGDTEVAEKGPSNKDKKTKKKKKDKGNSSAPDNEENGGNGSSERNNEKSTESNTEKDVNAASSKTKKRKKVTGTSSKKSTSGKKSEKVRFSGQDEVFPVPGDSSKEATGEDGAGNGSGTGDGLVRGKRFSKEEDALVQQAVYDYIERHQLGEDGVNMLMKCKEYPELKGCWKEIGEALPWRPYVAVYFRAHILFERGEVRKWTEEELELVRRFHKEHGADWKTLALELGKHRFHVKDAWRRIKLPNLKKGHWAQDEYQSLFDLVNMDLSMKAFQEKKSKHGMLRDNICWEAISEKLGTRTMVTCCVKWYDQLSSPLVAEGKWADTDDYRLLIALVELDAACEEDVDWDNLLEHRSGDICRKRWHQMVLHIGEHAIKPFNEQVEILSNRYCPDLLEPREVYANKPYVDV